MGQILWVTLRWSVSWAILGAIGGIALMFTKTPPIAESGAKPDDFLFYAFWIPLVGVAAGVFGFALGLLFSILMALTASWRAQREVRANFVSNYVPRVLCGIVAGALLGLPFLKAGYIQVFVFGGFGACSALVSGFLQTRSHRRSEPAL